jgi:ABC-type transporter Mla subunit MlaD
MRRLNRGKLAQVLTGLALALVVLVGLMFYAGFWRIGSSYRISAYVSNARGIAQDSTVFEAGLPVGLVTGIRRNGPDAILTLRIDNGPRPLPVDSKIQLGLRSLAGEADVLLMLGRSRQTVPGGGSLGLSQDEDYTEVDQILTVLDANSGTNVRRFIRGFGAGVAGEGENLNQTLGGTSALITNSLPVTSTLAAQHQQVADLVQNFGNVMQAVGQRTSAVQEFAQGSLRTFDAVAARDIALRRMLATLPAVARSFTAASNTIGTTSPHISPVVSSVARAVHATADACIEPRTPGGQRARSGIAGTRQRARRSIPASAIGVHRAASTARDALPARSDDPVHPTLRPRHRCILRGRRGRQRAIRPSLAPVAGRSTRQPRPIRRRRPEPTRQPGDRHTAERRGLHQGRRDPGL